MMRGSMNTIGAAGSYGPQSNDMYNVGGGDVEHYNRISNGSGNRPVNKSGSGMKQQLMKMH